MSNPGAKHKCEICTRPALPTESYCHLHEISHIRIKERFQDWQKAFGGISWERYLERIFELKETGDASREIARHLLDKGSK